MTESKGSSLRDPLGQREFPAMPAGPLGQFGLASYKVAYAAAAKPVASFTEGSPPPVTQDVGKVMSEVTTTLRSYGEFIKVSDILQATQGAEAIEDVDPDRIGYQMSRVTNRYVNDLVGKMVPFLPLFADDATLVLPADGRWVDVGVEQSRPPSGPPLGLRPDKCEPS